MGTPNEELLRKATVTTDALAAAGKLAPQQADKFIDFVIDETALKGNVRVVRVKTDWEINKLGVGKRVAMPASEAKDPGVRRGITTSKVTVNAKEIIIPFEIGDSFSEENIEGAAVEEHIIKLMARATANNLEELFLLGDLLGAASKESDLLDGGDAAKYVKDSYLALFDGVFRNADGGNIYNAAGAGIGVSVFGGMIRAMPTKFRRNLRDLRWFLSPDLMQLWKERLATRATAQGDAAIASSGVVAPFGIPGIELPLFPFQPRIVEHTGNIADGALFTARYAPIANVIVTLTGLGDVPAAPMTAGVDYTVDAAAGTIKNEAGGAWANNTAVKVTYDANPQILLTHRDNLIWAIGRDIRIEKDRDIFRRVNQYAITVKLGSAVEELTALVKARNIGTTI